MSELVPWLKIVKLHATTLERRLNLWCDDCLLPGGYDCTFAVDLDGEPLEVLHVAGCVECDD